MCKTSISVSYIFTIPLHIRELDSPQVDQLEAGFCTRERALKSHKEPSIVAMASMASSSVGHITCMLHGHITYSELYVVSSSTMHTSLRARLRTGRERGRMRRGGEGRRIVHRYGPHYLNLSFLLNMYCTK